MAPYLRLAKTAGDEDEFFETFFKLWFKRWPETPPNDSDSVVKGIKSVCANSTLTMAILIHCLKMVKNDYVYILLGVGIDTKNSRCDWRTGFLDEDAIYDEAPAAGPGTDIVAFDNIALTAGSDSDHLETNLGMMNLFIILLQKSMTSLTIPLSILDPNIVLHNMAYTSSEKKNVSCMNIHSLLCK